MKRRNFLRTVASLPVISSAYNRFDQDQLLNIPGCSNKLKISLNAYSFNNLLLDGSMKLDDLLEFCAVQGFCAVDITGYYFKGYPAVPSDAEIYRVKRRALSKGVEISGTGVRNDFTYPDKAKRQENIDLVRKWTDVAAKLGAPVIRIFAGNQELTGYTWDQAAEWISRDIITCVEYGKSRGVVVAVQNHDDFIKTADQALRIIQMVNSEWFGMILDTGSFRQGDPYVEISKTVHAAVNWQIKEEVYFGNESVKVDLVKLFNIIKASVYRGYLPLETLGEGDPFAKVTAFLEQARKALDSVCQF